MLQSFFEISVCWDHKVGFTIFLKESPHLWLAWRYPIWTLLDCLVMLLASAQACALSIQSSRSSWEIESISCSGFRSVAMTILLGGSE